MDPLRDPNYGANENTPERRTQRTPLVRSPSTSNTAQPPAPKQRVSSMVLAPSSTALNLSAFPMPLTLKQRCKILGLPVPKNPAVTITVFNNATRDVSKQFKFSYDTRVKDILKKINSEKTFKELRVSLNSSTYTDDNIVGHVDLPGATPEDAFALFLPADKESLVPSDEIKLDENYFLWNYDISPVQTLEWKELPYGLNFSSYVYLRIMVISMGFRASCAMKFNKRFLVQDMINIISQRIPSLRDSKKGKISYGLYMCVASPNSEDGTFVLMDPERTIESYKLSSMDILEFKQCPHYEFAFLTSNTSSDHPDTLSLPETTKVKDLVATVKGYLWKGREALADTIAYGLLYIPTNNHADLTQFEWMDEHKAIGEYNPQQYDIFEFKKKSEGESKAVTSTLEVNSEVPSTKLILVSVPVSAEFQTKIETTSPGQSREETTVKSEITLETGEQLLMEESQVAFYNKLLQKALWGSLIITNYQVIFVPAEPVDPYFNPFFRVPLTTIGKVDKIGKQDQYVLQFTCKDLRIIVLEFLQGKESRRKIIQLLDMIAFGSLSRCFAFQYNPLKFQGTKFTSSKDNGWNVYSVEEEFKRLFQNNPAPMWKITNINAEYRLSDSYPAQLIVPANATDELLRKVADYRSKGRIPVLCWAHPHNNATLTRASQPLAGLKRNRSFDDEYLLGLIREANMNNPTLYIFDARPRANALANFAVGGGFENTNFYPNTAIEFLNIANIHAMREALMKVQLLVDMPARWLTELDNSHWLEHIRLLLEGTGKVVDCLNNGTSVLLHCSDGWDRTAQFAALAEMCLDPFARTIAGMELLIEKEWVSFGHKFNERLGHSNKSAEDEQRSPIFLQFIDGTFQLMQQYPTIFEFNETFLITILEHLYSCKYGTFLFNNEKERAEMNVRTKTVSLWTHINSDTENYLNPFYVPVTDTIMPSSNMEDIVFWKSYYLRYHRKQKAFAFSPEVRAKMLQNTAQNLKDRVNEADKAKEELQKEIERLQQELAKLKPSHDNQQ